MSTEVAPDVYQQRLAHSKVIYLADEQLLIDTGPESEWEGIQSFIETQGSIERVFLSHAHGDHIGNIERVVESYDPEVLFPENEPLDDVPLTEDDVTRVSDGESLGDGVEVVEVPGHTAGICAVYLSDHKTLLGTDVLDGSDRRGLPAGYLLPPPGLYNWDSKQAEVNLERLLDLEFDTVVVTHGTNVDEDAHHKLDAYLNFPEHYRKDLLERLD